MVYRHRGHNRGAGPFLSSFTGGQNSLSLKRRWLDLAGVAVLEILGFPEGSGGEVKLVLVPAAHRSARGGEGLQCHSSCNQSQNTECYIQHGSSLARVVPAPESFRGREDPSSNFQVNRAGRYPGWQGTRGARVPLQSSVTTGRDEASLRRTKSQATNVNAIHRTECGFSVWILVVGAWIFPRPLSSFVTVLGVKTDCRREGSATTNAGAGETRGPTLGSLFEQELLRAGQVVGVD